MPSFHDRARPEKTDAGDDIGDHPHAAVRAGQVVGEIDESGGADRDENIGAQARAALPVLAFGANQRAEHERSKQANEGVEEVEELKVCRNRIESSPGGSAYRRKIRTSCRLPRDISSHGGFLSPARERDHPADGTGYSHRH
jgi:hypothetical protein